MIFIISFLISVQETPLLLSIKSQKPNIAKILIQNNANCTLGNAIEVAKENNYIDLVELMSTKKTSKWKTDTPKNKIMRVSSAVLTQHRVRPRPRSISKNSVLSKSITGEDETIESLLRKVESVQFQLSKDKKVDMKKAPSAGITVVREFLKKAIQQADISPNTLEIKWAKLFQQRMIESSSILSSKRIENLNSVISSYTKQEFTGTTYWEVAHSLQQYLQTHKFDPENSIIGLKCKPSIIGEFQYFASNLLECEKIFGNDIWQIGKFNENSSSSRASTASDPSQHVQFNIFIQKTHIYSFIQQILASNESSDVKMNKVDKFIQFCETIDKLPNHWPNKIESGDILLVLLPANKFHSYYDNNSNEKLFSDENEHFISKLQKVKENDEKDIYSDIPKISSSSTNQMEFRFMRFTGGFDRESRLLYVYTNGKESKIEKIPIHFCMPFPKSWNMNFGSKKSMDRLIENPANILFSHIGSYLRNSIDELLKSKKINMKLLERIIMFNIEVSESSQIRELLTNLQSLQIEFPKKFLLKMNKLSSDCTTKFFNSKLINEMFIPTKQNYLTDLQGICMENLIQKRLVKLISYCHQGLEYLESQKKLVVNGTKKQEITNWWLHVIETHVQTFLQNISYNFSVVRHDYIETPPENLENVRNNLIIIKDILDLKSDKYHVKSLLDTIKSIVYPKIDLFVTNAKIAICDKLRIQENEFDINNCLNLIQNSNFIDTVSSVDDLDLLEDLLKDIEYLETIKRLEINQAREKKDLNVVPISGLVMGSFYRLENELKTILEVWDPTWKITKNNLGMKRTSAEKRVTMLLATRSESIRGTTHSILNPRFSSEMNQNSSDISLSLTPSSLLNLKIKTSDTSSSSNILNLKQSQNNGNNNNTVKTPLSKFQPPLRKISVSIDFDDFGGLLGEEENNEIVENSVNNSALSPRDEEPEIVPSEPETLLETTTTLVLNEEGEGESPRENLDLDLDAKTEESEESKEDSDPPVNEQLDTPREDAVVMINVDDIMENLNQLENLSRKGSTARLYASERQNLQEEARRYKPGSANNKSKISIKKIFRPK